MPKEKEISEPTIIESHYLSENLLDYFPSNDSVWVVNSLYCRKN